MHQSQETNYFILSTGTRLVDEVGKSGHGELLELRLLEKSARHDFIIARQRSSNNYFSCQLVESS